MRESESMTVPAKSAGLPVTPPSQLLEMYRRIGLHNQYKTVDSWHAAMLDDEPRNDAYKAAIVRARPTEHDLVLDIGTGAGLTAMLAATAGAKHVYTCEANPAVARRAVDIIAQNGLADRITVIPKRSTELSVGVDLPAKASLITTEIFDFKLLGEGVLPTMTHALGELAEPNAVVIPQSATLQLALVESPMLYRKRNVSKASGFDMSAFGELYRYSVFSEHIQYLEHRILSEPVEALRLDFHRGQLSAPLHTISLKAARPGTAHALVGWFDLQLDGLAHVTSEIGRKSCHWKQLVSLLDAPREVAQDEVLQIDVSHDQETVFLHCR